MSKFYEVTPIYYVNAKPHIGHAYATIAADIIARYHRDKGDDTYLQTGTDEHGEKIQEAAKKEGISEKDFVDKYAKHFRDYWDKLGIDYDGFVRTTDKGHIEAAQYALSQMHEKGFIYKGKYKSTYCVGCEQYLTKSDLEKGMCPVHQKEPRIKEEDAYLFKMSAFQETLIQKITDDELEILPKSRKNEVLTFIKSGLEDISISRPQSQCSWGVELPFDKDHTVYVWVEAFLNYITGIGWPNNMKKFRKYWPADLQILGKDILRVHGTIWASILLALDLPLPKRIFSTGFLLSGGRKMSKSLGNVIDPLEVSGKYGNDVLRHFLFSEVAFGQDGDVTIERLEERYNSDLSNGLGNLVQRVAVMIDIYLGGKIPKGKTEVDKKPYERHMESLELHKAVEYIWSEIQGLDQYIEEEKPWQLAKEKDKRLKDVLGNLAISIIKLNEMLAPFMPETAEKIDKIYGGSKIKLGKPLFPRLEK